MSYILRALKRADQERRQGRAPSLSDGPPLELPPFPARRMGWLAVGGVLLLCALVASVVWWVWLPWRVAVEGPLEQIASVSSTDQGPRDRQEPVRQAGPEAAAASPTTPKPDLSAKTPTLKPGPAAAIKPTTAPNSSAGPSPAEFEDAPATDDQPRAWRDMRRADQRGPGGRTGGSRIDPESRGQQRPESRFGRRGSAAVVEAPAPTEPAALEAPSVPPEATAAGAPIAVPAPAVNAPVPQSKPADSEAKAQAGRELTEQLARVAPAPATENTVPDWRELPLETRKAIPEMKFSMLVYSEQPAERLLSINGKVCREGAAVDTDLTLLEITPDGAIFRYKTTTFHKGVF